MNRAERFERLVAEVNKKNYPSMEALCRLFEVKPRTVYADLAYLRDYMEVDIKHDTERGGYYNPDPTKKLLPFNITQGELIALTLGKDMLTEYSGTVFEPILRTALDKIAERLPEKVVLDLPSLVGVVRFKSSGIAHVPRPTFFDLNRACEEQLVVHMQYASASNLQTTFRDVEPLRLVQNRVWYLIGWCRLRDSVRMFALHRILEHKVLSEEFDERDFDIENYLSTAFLLEHGDPQQTYVIKFDQSSAPYVTEREWHPSQTITKHDDGSCTMTFTATSINEVKRWVLVFGASAEVLEPKELRAALRTEFERAHMRYSIAPLSLKPKKQDIAASVNKGPTTGSLAASNQSDD